MYDIEIIADTKLHYTVFKGLLHIYPIMHIKFASWPEHLKIHEMKLCFMMFCTVFWLSVLQ